MNVGDTFICPETGKTITVARDGCSYNYAYTSEGGPVSDEGVHIRSLRALAARNGPFTCYLSGDGKTVTGWKGDVLGTVHNLDKCRHPWMHRNEAYYSFTVRTANGLWYGRGSRGMAVAIRPKKG